MSFEPSSRSTKPKTIKPRKFILNIPEQHEEAFWILYQMQLTHGAHIDDALCHMIVDNFDKSTKLPQIPRLHEYYKCRLKTIGQMFKAGEITKTELAEIYLGVNLIWQEIANDKTLLDAIQEQMLDKKQT